MIFSFEKEVLEQLEKSTKYEWLESNHLGAYASSTIIGLNTRRQHGLLCIPYGDSYKKAVVLSKLEESVFIDNQLFEISTNRYSDSIFPQGYHFIEKFEMNPFPCTHFKIQERLLKKTLFLIDNENTLVVRYELRNQGKPVKLVIKPFLAGRDSEELTTEVQGLNTDSYVGQNFVRWAPKPDMPYLNVHFNRGEFIPATLWYHNLKYSKDIRPTDYEDLLNPGFFQVELKPYQTFDLYISSDELNDFALDYEKIYREQSAQRFQATSVSAPEYIHLLLDQTVKKGSPLPLSQMGFDRSLRKYILSLPGLFTVFNDTNRAIESINAILAGLERGLLPTEFPFKKKRNLFNEADTPLWLINAVYSLYLLTKERSIFTDEMLLKFKEIITSYTKGTVANIYVDKNGLVFSGDKNTDTSWFDRSDLNGKFHRHGYLLEVNALWYNALKILEDIYIILDKKRLASKYKKMAQKTEESFQEKFKISDHSAFYDFVGTEYVGEDYKLNQIIPLSLPFTPCTDELAQNVLKQIDEVLLTPYGLREQGIKQNSENDRDVPDSEKQTSIEAENIAWLWTISFYIQAALKYKSDNPNIKTELLQLFQPVFDLLSKNVLGNFSEAVRLDPLGDAGVPDSLLSLSSISYAYNVLLKE